MSERARATFEIASWDEQPYQELEGEAKLTRASVTQAFHGDIEGEGTSEMLLHYPEATSASFVGLQRVVGRLAGRSGSFVLRATGTYEDGTATTSWTVVPGSGTGELRGLRGEGGYVAKQEEYPKVPVTLDYDFE